MTAKKVKIMDYGVRPGNEDQVAVEMPLSTMEQYRYSWADKMPKEPANASARGSLGFGVASMVFSGLLGIIFAFVSFAKAAKAKGQGDNSEARKAGVLFGVLGLVGSLAMIGIIVCGIIFGGACFAGKVAESKALVTEAIAAIL